MDALEPKPAPRPRSPSGARAQATLADRRRAARLGAAARAAKRVARPVSSAQRTRDPLWHGRSEKSALWLRTILPVVASIAIHVGVVGLGFVTGGPAHGQRENIAQKISIEVREPPPPPPPPAPEKLPEVPAQVESPKPRLAKASPPPKAAPAPTPPPAPVDEPPPQTPPPRVVGLSMESTSEGGTGPAFAVGNTRAGTTDTTAKAPSEVPTTAPAEPAFGTNQVASRLPSQGVRYIPPQRKKKAEMIYPAMLKAQGIEADVKVSLSIDASGKVTAVRILAPAPYPEFNDAAKAMALAEEYEPATRDGTPIPYSLPFTYRFRLEDQ